MNAHEWVTAARAALAADQWDEALDLSGNAIEAGPDLPDGYLARAEVFLAAGMHHDALASSTEALRCDGERADVLSMLYRAQLLAGRYGAAKKTAAKLVERGIELPVTDAIEDHDARGRTLPFFRKIAWLWIISIYVLPVVGIIIAIAFAPFQMVTEGSRGKGITLLVLYIVLVSLLVSVWRGRKKTPRPR